LEERQFSQLSLISDLARLIRIDPFTVLPKDISLKILGYLDATSLCRAAQVTKRWKALADDNVASRVLPSSLLKRSDSFSNLPSKQHRSNDASYPPRSSTSPFPDDFPSSSSKALVPPEMLNRELDACMTEFQVFARLYLD